jgi:lysophospholipase L1-like esterase
VRVAVPGVRIIAFGPATPQGLTPNLTMVKNIIQAKATEHGFDFIDQDGWITMSNEGYYIGVDNVHPNSDGHRYLGERKAQAVAALLSSL